LQEQVRAFVVDIFSVNRVRYTSIEDLSEDVMAILRTRVDLVQNRFSSEVIPAN
jgi:hypothetical protein